MSRFAARLCLVMAVALICAASSLSRAAADTGYTVEVADVGNSRDFVSVLQGKGYSTVIPPKNMWVTDQQSNCGVWIGKNVPLEMLRVVLPEAIRFNPYLKFFYIVGDRGEKPPQAVDNTVHVGGHIEAALVKKLNTIDQQEMLAQLGKAATLEELHRYLHEKNKPKPVEKSAS
ncbi:hypothetical protein KP001_06855 [Geomonas subterranea]|uniref:Uncharacterized protein n=1 Tax=Geomonas subterranea TaxID=2847989 RepID=A0ABX8LKH7_9BACT|nr:hypothetical protein [Geomonas subterranea]QXE92233.1 hypothetical protein KP001_06855 [Geomonas subterranea]QXM09667.1 hypothetical protein KP002_00640 [Geomonas subterranea]